MSFSHAQYRGPVTFPAFAGERIYMLPFRDRLPSGYAHWQPTVDAMLDGIDHDECYLMVDQRVVDVGQTHRRAGVHVDNYWDPGSARHAPAHSARHAPAQPSLHYRAEAILLASSVLGSDAWLGEYTETPGDGGDCSHIPLDTLWRVPLVPNVCWAGHTATLLHANRVMTEQTRRTVVRINVPGWAP